MKKWWHKLRGFESFRVQTKVKMSDKMDWNSARAFAAVTNGVILFDPDHNFEFPGAGGL